MGGVSNKLLLKHVQAAYYCCNSIWPFVHPLSSWCCWCCFNSVSCLDSQKCPYNCSEHHNTVSLWRCSLFSVWRLGCRNSDFISSRSLCSLWFPFTRLVYYFVWHWSCGRNAKKKTKPPPLCCSLTRVSCYCINLSSEKFFQLCRLN